MKFIKELHERAVDFMFGKSDNPYIQAVKRPEVYFNKLFKHTLVIGGISFMLNLIYINFYHDFKMPSGIHTLVGFVIAMLLVFRTNTAYERWWEGRKKIQELNSNISFFLAMLNAYKIDNLTRIGIKTSLGTCLSATKTYLMSERDGRKTFDFHKFQMERVTTLVKDINDLNDKNVLVDAEANQLRGLLKEVLDDIISLERIKNTPIPLAYSIHIKLTILIYVLTLPFSLFYDLGMWSTVVVMFLYFMIAGVEIISSEIENPFSGEPNDLPVDDLIEGIRKHL